MAVSSTKKFLTGVKEYSLITLGVIIYVAAWIIFLLPNNLIGGGATGIASIIQYATGIKAGYTYFVINVGLLIAAIFTLGKNFGSKSVYAIILTSVGLNLGQELVPQEFIQIMALDNGKLMSTIIGGVLVGIGIGMTMTQGGSTGGTDIVALIMNKYRGISPGRTILAIDVVVILFSMVMPSYTTEGALIPVTEKITIAVYAWILIFVMTSVLDAYVSGSRQSMQIFVFSKKYEEIADAVTGDLHRGVTVLDGTGWYTKTSSKVLMIVTLKSDLNTLLKFINSIDSDAFISVSSATAVYGKGFDTIKVKDKNKSKE
ncbi:MAG: YitT family protein [Bacteroidales bacterium]|nr:YitT family protein [Bacteroidales bacterium]